LGAIYRSVREADLNIQLAYELLDFFNQDEKFQPFITRDRAGNYEAWFSEYYEKQQVEVRTFRDYLKKVISFLKREGSFKTERQVYHNPAADNVSLKLYAINKLANDYNLDIVLHIHFNDYPKRSHNIPGEYTGFAIYIPEKQLPNYRTSLALAESIKSRLEKYFIESNFPGEINTIVEDQELIAIGSNASREGASLLVEYGYIYEWQFVNSDPRSAIMKELAAQTYWGIKDYFATKSEVAVATAETTLLPYRWELPLRKGMNGFLDVVHLQMALLKEGLYPPAGKTLRDCPLNGNFGSCTLSAVKAFQQQYGIAPTGFVGPRTLEKLNSLYRK
jgi:N-acetylmuramoyl-L-alanine amidase